MNGLNEIVARNREAVKQGVAKPGSLVGTANVKPKPVEVVSNLTGKVLGVYDDATTACNKYRQAQREGLVSINDVE